MDLLDAPSCPPCRTLIEKQLLRRASVASYEFLASQLQQAEHCEVGKVF